jgi:hypothetical protein
MPKIDSIIDIRGTIHGMTFMKTQDGILVRKKGGVDKKRIMQDPAFQRTRENGSEFGHSAKMGQLLRKSAANLVGIAKDGRVSSRLNQVMNQVKNFDFTSGRGARKVWIGLEETEGKMAMKGFEFNAKSPFSSVFRSSYSLDTATGTVSIGNFNPTTNLGIPGGATHAGFEVAMARVDFENGTFQTTYSEEEQFTLTDQVLQFTLQPSEVPTGNGFTFYLFLIAFYQEVNGVLYPLRNNSFNALHVMEVV